MIGGHHSKLFGFWFSKRRSASWRGKNGLISEAPNYMFMDWVKIAGFGCHYPPAVIGLGYMTAFYYRALHDARRVAELAGDKFYAENYSRLRGQVEKAFNRELWSAKESLYRDGRPFQTSVKPSQWLPADKDIETFSTQVNTLTVLYDLAPKTKQGAIMDTLMARPDLKLSRISCSSCWTRWTMPGGWTSMA